MKRRTFIHNSLLLTAGLMVGCKKDIHFNRIKTVKGRVVSGSVAIEGAIVSDGHNVVATNSTGHFNIDLSHGSKHIFVSIPAGYEFPEVNSIASHFKAVHAIAPETLFSTVGVVEFNLKPLQVDDTQHQFLICADPQIRKEADINKLMSEFVPDVQKIRKSLPDGTLIHGITVGDIVGDTLDLFTNYNAAVEQVGLPFFQVIGNHDLVLNKGGGENCRVAFKNAYGPTYYSFNRGKVHYVVLDNVEYFGYEMAYRGHIPPEQLSWLRKDLSFIPTDHLVVVSMHIPLIFCEASKAEVYEILKPYKAHVMSGHMHYNENVIRDNVYEHIHGTVCGAWWTGSICADGAPNGYMIYEVDGADLKWHYKSIGQPKEYQVRSTIVKESDKIFVNANVWNWDAGWTVEWYKDGAYGGKMNRVNGFDNLANKLYAGADLPAGDAWIDPIKTNHLFSAQVSAGVNQVKVVATDRFGQVFESVSIV